MNLDELNLNELERKLTPEVLERIRADLRNVPDEPVGPHLKLAEIWAYAKGKAGSQETERIDRHTESCLECSEKVERCCLVVDWLAQAVAQLAQKFDFALAPVRAPAIAFKTKVEASAVSPDNLVGVHTVEDESGNIELRTGIRNLDLAGARVTLSIGQYRREAVLKQVDPENVGAIIHITAEERQTIPAHAEVRIELSGEPPSKE